MENLSLWLLVVGVFTGILGLGCMYLAWSFSSAQRSLRKLQLQMAQWNDRLGTVEEEQRATSLQLKDQQQVAESLRNQEGNNNNNNNPSGGGSAGALSSNHASMMSGKASNAAAGGAGGPPDGSIDPQRNARQVHELVQKVARLESDVYDLQRRVQSIAGHVDSFAQGGKGVGGGVGGAGGGPSDGVLLELVQDLRRRRGGGATGTPLSPLAVSPIMEIGATTPDDRSSVLAKLRRRVGTASSPRGGAPHQAFRGAIPTTPLEGHDVSLPTNLPPPFTSEGWSRTPSQSDVRNTLHHLSLGYRHCRIDTGADGKGNVQITLTYLSGMFKNKVLVLPLSDCATVVVSLETALAQWGEGGGNLPPNNKNHELARRAIAAGQEECVCLLFRLRTPRNQWISNNNAESAGSPLAGSRTSWSTPPATTPGGRGSAASSGTPLAVEEHRTLRMVVVSPITAAVDEWVSFLDETLGIIDVASLPPTL